jgi:hypothetical protein
MMILRAGAAAAANDRGSRAFLVFRNRFCKSDVQISNAAFTWAIKVWTAEFEIRVLKK